MSFIALEINIGTKQKPDWQPATTKADTSINIEETSAVWDTSNGGGAFAYEFALPVEDNMNILGISCDMHGRSIYKQLYGKQFRLYCLGLCLFYGIIKMDETVEIEEDEEGNHTVGITLVSNNYEWGEMLDGVSARDVQLATATVGDDGINRLDEDCIKIPIGYCVPSAVPVKLQAKAELYGTDGGRDDHFDKKWDGGRSLFVDKNELGVSRTFEIDTAFYIPKFLLTKLGDKQGALSGTSFANTDMEYPEKEYCNVRICYPHYVQKEDGWEKGRGYGIGAPDRINSAPCFFVLYWLKLLLKQLGVCVKENILEEYQDIRRLAFYHTDCHYEEIREEDIDLEKADVELSDGQVVVKEMNRTDHTNNIAACLAFGRKDLRGMLECNKVYPYEMTALGDKKVGAMRFFVTELQVFGHEPIKINEWNPGTQIETVVPLYKAYATSDNFPDTDAKEILEGLQNAFGARFLYDAKTGSIRIVLVKDILSQDTAELIPCDIDKVTKTENHITGFRLKYSSTEVAKSNGITLKEDLTGEKRGTEGSDTTFSYNNFTRLRMLNPKGGDDKYDPSNTTHEYRGYAWLMNKVDAYDKTCFVHPLTGNTFRFKVNGDAQSGKELNPALFEVAQFNAAEWGNCSNHISNRDFIEEVVIGFNPIIENDVNCTQEKIHNPDMILHTFGFDTNSGVLSGQKLAQLVDGEIYTYTADDVADSVSREGTFINSSVEYEMPIKTFDAWAEPDMKYNGELTGFHGRTTTTPYMPVTLHVASIDSWDLAGEEPTQDNDTGFTLGIMRGSGSNASSSIYDADYDGEKSAKWLVTPGTEATFSADCIDQYGTWYDYNGSSADDIIDITSPIDGQVVWIMAQGDTNILNPSTPLVRIFNSDTLQNEAILYQNRIFIITEIVKPYGSKVSKGDVIMRISEVHYDNPSDKPTNGIGYDPKDALSLRLRASKPNPGYNEEMSRHPERFPIVGEHRTADGYKYTKDGQYVFIFTGTNKYTKIPNTKYLPIADEYAHRGLADRFYNEYAYWVLNRKIANITCDIELAELVKLDMTKKYKIGEYEGFIKSLSYTIDNETGLSPVDIEFYYL